MGHRALLLALAVWVATPASAEVLTFEFEGVVARANRDGGLFPSGVQVDDVFTGSFSYEVGPGNPDDSPQDPDLGIYQGISLQVDGGFPVSNLTISVERVELEGVEGFQIVGEHPGYALVRLALVAPYGTVFPDDSLPETLGMDGLLFATLLGSGVGGSAPGPGGGGIVALVDDGDITALPEPEAALGVALAALAGLARGAALDRRSAHASLRE